MSNIESREFPRNVALGVSTVTIDVMTPADGADYAAFARTVPTHDLLFVPRDLGHPKVIAAWMEAIEYGRITSLVAREDGHMVGCSAIVTDPLSWSRHVGELRVVVGPGWRGRKLGRALVQESFAVALGLGLEKLTVQMTVDQPAAIALFEELGFRAEAVLRNHVKDKDGKTYDLALLSHDVVEVQSRLSLYGLTEAMDS